MLRWPMSDERQKLFERLNFPVGWAEGMSAEEVDKVYHGTDEEAVRVLEAYGFKELSEKWKEFSN